MDCSCDAGVEFFDGSNAFSSISKRTARKEHKCSECGRTIHKGETYEYTAGKYDGAFYSVKMCLDCESISNEFFSSGGYEYGRMFEYLHDFISSCRGDIPETCIRKCTPSSRIKIASIIDEYMK